MSQLRAVSLFSNCGAGDVGYRDAGFRFDVMAELDPRRLEVCLLNHPDAVGVEGDLRKTWTQVVEKYNEIAGETRPSLLCACPPCQGMSSARSGKGAHDDAVAGSKDERNLLVTVIAKVAHKLKPSMIVVENVPAFLTRKVHHPKDKRPVSAANYLISSLSKDYIAFPFIADLCNFGVPQSRNRAFLTLIRKDVEGLSELLKLGRAPFPRPTHDPLLGGEDPISLSRALQGFNLPALDARRIETASVTGYNDFHTVPVWDERIYSMIAAIPQGSGNSAWQNSNCLNCGSEVLSLDTVKCSCCDFVLPRPTVREKDGSYRLVKGFKTSYKRMHNDRPASTVTTASGHIGSDNTIHPTQNRVLSILECALLQTFPMNFRWGDALKNYGISHMREMIGEAVPPAFTKQHGDILQGILNLNWCCPPISEADDRCIKAWNKLSDAADKDNRKNPKTFYESSKKAILSSESNRNKYVFEITNQRYFN